MAGPDVWVAKADGTDIIRADAIVAVGIDYDGHVRARLAEGEVSTVTLISAGPAEGPRTPSDFHRQLVRVVTELADATGAFLVRPVHAEPGGWRWLAEPL
ncbi:MAG TPA: hypothetical protein VLW50_07450 [Streptosporangiaceae bacterium]|nr:hypothetical protein [Streptosporangiaceae bacterium]